MTIAELNRAVNSWNRVHKALSQEKAIHNYILAGLIGKTVLSAFSEQVEVPKLEEVYSSLFEDKAEERKAELDQKRTELSVIRFIQFANSHNEKYKQQEVANIENE